MKSPALLERLSWPSLSCHDRALAIAAENQRKNAGACFALFRMLGSDRFERYQELRIGDELYYHFIERITGVSLSRLYVPADCFVQTVASQLESGNLLVCATDNRYQPKSNNFGKKSHLHFLAVGPGLTRSHLEVLDEDWDARYWVPDNCKDGIRYLSKTVSMDELASECLRMRGTGINFPGFSEKESDSEFAFCYFISAQARHPLPPWDIYMLYREQLEDMLQHAEEHRRLLCGYMQAFYDEFDAKSEECPCHTLEDAASILKNDPFGLKKYIYYPRQLRILLAHAQHLTAQQQVFSFLKPSWSQPALELLPALLSKYNILQNLILVSIVQKKRDGLNRAFSLFISLYEKELETYQLILSHPYLDEHGEWG